MRCVVGGGVRSPPSARRSGSCRRARAGRRGTGSRRTRTLDRRADDARRLARRRGLEHGDPRGERRGRVRRRKAWRKQLGGEAPAHEGHGHRAQAVGLARQERVLVHRVRARVDVRQRRRDAVRRRLVVVHDRRRAELPGRTLGEDPLVERRLARGRRPSSMAACGCVSAVSGRPARTLPSVGSSRNGGRRLAVELLNAGAVEPNDEGLLEEVVAKGFGGDWHLARRVVRAVCLTLCRAQSLVHQRVCGGCPICFLLQKIHKIVMTSRTN